MKKTILMILGLLAIGNTFICTEAKADPESSKEQSAEPCNPKTFNSICSGDKLLICAKGEVKVIDCSENGNKEKTCAEFKESKIARCISEKEKCTQEGEIVIKQTEYGPDQSIRKKYKCEKTVHGALYYHEIRKGNKTNSLNKEITQNDNVQGKQIEDEFKCSKENDLSIRDSRDKAGKITKDYYRCERSADGILSFRKLTQKEITDDINKTNNPERPSSSATVNQQEQTKVNIKQKDDNSCNICDFKERCENNHIVKCIDRQIKRINCKKNKKYNTCMQTADLKDIQCISKKDVCSNINDIITRYETDEHGKKMKRDYQCRKAANGELLYFNSERADPRPKDSCLDLPF